MRQPCPNADMTQRLTKKMPATLATESRRYPNGEPAPERDADKESLHLVRLTATGFHFRVLVFENLSFIRAILGGALPSIQ